MNYLENVDKRIIEYFNILEPEFPVWLNDYINTQELLSQRYKVLLVGLFIQICLKVIFSFLV